MIEPVFSVIPANVAERTDATDPEAIVRALSLAKARAIKADQALVIGADTIVFLEGTVFGKPRDAKDAENMLQMLSGREHFVYTGVSVASLPERVCYCDTACTKVVFDEISEEERKAYICTGDPLDKAGAYGIQGYAARFVKRIEGCYYNVVGLPIWLTYHLLKQARRENCE